MLYLQLVNFKNVLFQVTRPVPSPGAQEELWLVSPVCVVEALTAPARVLSETYPILSLRKYKDLCWIIFSTIVLAMMV